ncbi:MAG: pentapeptide repeat-containing protein [Verrucomicrobia bacterium]|nr:pentapeptide repeat-containing protein [Verrucomicrobiota bacterium]MCH8511218.1 hypothetical protein [Kiritimatiellia bacterium]
MLHYEGEKDSAEFRAAVQSKLAANDGDFRGVHFHFPIGLKNQNINYTLDFSGSKFSNGVEIIDSTFEKLLIFRQCRFTGPVSIKNVSVYSEEEADSFTSSQIKQAGLSDVNTRILTGLIFSGSTFEGGLTLSGIKICNVLHLDHCHCHAPVKILKVNDEIVQNNENGTLHYLFEICITNSVFEDLVKFSLICNPTRITVYGVDVKQLAFTRINCKDGMMFTGANFGASVHFQDCNFGGMALFQNVSCQGDVIFSECQNGMYAFGDSVIEGKLIFKDAVLDKGMWTKGLQINGGLELSGNTLAGESDIENASFGPGATVVIDRNEIHPDSKAECVGYFFKNLTFNPFKTEISNRSQNDDMPPISIGFDNCSLEGALFKKCDFGKIYTFTSSIYGSRFVQCQWPKVNGRQVHAEEIYLNSCPSGTTPKKIKGMLEALGSREVINLYSRFVKVFDDQRQYALANEFYFSEMEAKRKNTHSRAVKSLLWVYKELSWYGHRPLRSLCVCFGLVTFFTFYASLTGLSIDKQVSNYFSTPSSPAYVLHYLGNCLKYSIGMLVPLRLFEFSGNDTYLASSSFLSYVVTLLYAISVNISAYFVIVGIRRHFKRF